MGCRGHSVLLKKNGIFITDRKEIMGLTTDDANNNQPSKSRRVAPRAIIIEHYFPGSKSEPAPDARQNASQDGDCDGPTIIDLTPPQTPK